MRQECNLSESCKLCSTSITFIDPVSSVLVDMLVHVLVALLEKLLQLLIFFVGMVDLLLFCFLDFLKFLLSLGQHSFELFLPLLGVEVVILVDLT